MEPYQWISVIISALTLLGLGTVMQQFWKSRAEKRKEESLEVKQLKEAERKKRITDAMNESIQPIMEKLSILEEKDEKLVKGIQANLRHNLYEIADEYLPKGYCPNEVKIDFDNLYNQYHTLGKNGVMDHIKDEIMALPSAKPEDRSNNAEENK